MNSVEKMVDALKKEDEVEGKLVDEFKHDVAISQKKLQHGEGVKYCAVARVVTEYGPKAVPVEGDHYSYDKKHMFDNMLDKSCLDFEEYEYEEEMCNLANKDNTLLYLMQMCSVNLDLADVVTEDL